MQRVDGLMELRGQGRMTWIDEEHRWVAAPEDSMSEPLPGTGTPNPDRDPYKDDGGEA